MNDAPHIVVCVPASERPFGNRVAELLTARRLRISLVTEVPQLQQSSPPAAICLVVGSDAHDTGLVVAAIAAAAATHCPLFPLLPHGEASLPAALKQTQWSDFSQGFWSGWRGLALALDMEHLSRWPYDAQVFDGAVALARAQNGLPQPGWQIYRGFARLDHRFTAKSLVECLSVIFLSFLAWLINPANWLAYLVIGGLVLLITLDRSRYRLWGHVKDGPIIVITPGGFVNLTSTGFEAHAFAGLKTIDIHEAVVTEGSTETTITQLVLTGASGTQRLVIIPAIYDTKLTPFLYPTPRRARDIAERIVAAFHQVQQPESDIVYRGPKSRIFLSYAHRDERMASTLEETLRNVGMEPWVDRSRLKVGTRWEEEIGAAIAQCEALILLISPAAVASRYVNDEFDLAVKAHKPVIGVIIHQCSMLPEQWRPYIRGEVRQRYGGLHDFWPVFHALDQAGALPESMTQRREQAAHFVLARAMAHAPLPDEQVFVGGPMSVVDMLTFLGLGIGLAAAALLIPLLVIPAYAVSMLVVIVWMSQIPDKREFIVIFPTGIAYILLGQVHATAFRSTDDWRIKQSTSGGTVCQLQEKRFIAIPSRFYQHRQIALQMIDAFQRGHL